MEGSKTHIPTACRQHACMGGARAQQGIIIMMMYSLRPFLIVACASQKIITDNYILKNINIYNT